jgi:hypothetical protein
MFNRTTVAYSAWLFTSFTQERSKTLGVPNVFFHLKSNGKLNMNPRSTHIFLQGVGFEIVYPLIKGKYLIMYQTKLVFECHA